MKGFTTDYWKVLTYPSIDMIPSVIQTWYYDEDPLTVWSSFQHVMCINVKKDNIPCQNDVDPYEFFLFLFYEIKPVFNEVCILGTRTWPDLDDKMLFERSKSFLMPWEPAGGEGMGEEDGYEDSVEDGDQLSSPTTHGGGGLPIILPFDASPTAKSFESCANQAYSYVLGKNIRGCWDRLTSSVVSLFTKQVAHLIKNKEIMRRYMLDRVRIEQILCRQHMDHYNEMQVLDVMFGSHMDTYLNEAMIVIPTKTDKQCFYRRFGNCCAPPNFCFRVAVEEIPDNLIKRIPWYNGGVVHLTYKDVSAWVCNVIQIQSQTLGPSGEPLGEPDERLKLVADMVVELYSKLAPPPSAPSGQKRREHVKVEYENEISSSELEQIVPPCFKRIMQAKQFPKHWQRLKMLSTFRQAGVEMEVYGHWLKEKNKRYPLDKGTDLKSRFNYQSEWNNDNSVLPISCANIFQNTRDRLTEQITCPFMEQHLGTPGAEDLCKKECMPDEKIQFKGPTFVINRLRHRYMFHKLNNNNKSNAAVAETASTTKTSPPSVDGLK